MGLGCERRAQLDLAIEAYSKALEHRKDNDAARLHRGLAYAKKGNNNEARADLDAFLKRGAGTTFEVEAAAAALYRSISSGAATPP